MPSPLAQSSLFKPIHVGTVTLQNRLVHAPETRAKCSKDNVATDSMLSYYSQRAENNGGLLIFEGTYPCKEFCPKETLPVIETSRQVRALGMIAAAVHERGSYISLQLANAGNGKNVSALESEEILFFIEEYGKAARRAVRDAGFHFAEVFACGSAFPAQFLDERNTREDQYGGTVENKARFVIDSVDSLISAVGADHTGVRIAAEENVGGVSSYILNQLEKKGIAYVSFLGPVPSWVREAWSGVVIQTGGLLHAEDNAGLADIVDADDLTLIGSASYYSSNPDLAERLRQGLRLTEPPDSSMLFSKDNSGYLTWGKYGEEGVEDKRIPRALINDM